MDRITARRIVPVIALHRAEQAEPLAETLPTAGDWAAIENLTREALMHAASVKRN